MNLITKAAQDDQALAALDRLVETHSRNYHPFANPLASDAQSALRHIRAALQDKGGDVRCYEPAGFLLHWPAPGGGREILWSKDGEAGRAIGCPVTEIFKATDRDASQQKGDPV